jgi:hypothetical protein
MIAISGKFFKKSKLLIFLILVMTLVDMLVGINTPKLNVPSTFRPTHPDRGWLVPPFDGNEFWTAPLAIVPALLGTTQADDNYIDF